LWHGGPTDATLEATLEATRDAPVANADGRGALDRLAGRGQPRAMAKRDEAPSPMDLALEEAAAAAAAGEVPVGAVLVDAASGALLARGHNRVETDKDPTAHAELLVIRDAARRLGAKRLTEADLYVSLEPCAMCAQAIAFARLRRLVFAAYDPKGGGVEHGPRIFAQATCHHRPEVVGGVQERRAGELLKAFFRERR
jgi:tRNA(adenine34) deaminase